MQILGLIEIKWIAPTFRNHIKQLLREEHKIQAITAWKVQYGCSLTDAKVAVDRIQCGMGMHGVWCNHLAKEK